MEILDLEKKNMWNQKCTLESLTAYWTAEEKIDKVNSQREKQD